MTAIPILCLHAVSEDTGGPLAPWAMTPTRLDEHLDAIAEAGYRPLPLDVLVARVHHRMGSVPPGAMAITIDDGYADVVGVIWPRLVARGWPATLFVSTAFAGGHFLERPMLSRQEVADLAADGLGIGAHGHRHIALDAVAPEVARADIVRSRDLLEDWLGRRITEFAYPHGFHSRRTKIEVRAAGFTSACAVKQALSSPTDDPFALARVMP
ncbi:MAG TPA: polysaccharide deacetylase family protein, partial [Acidimicrobiales bacterium]|nr:polysaccharide deacetylase family protein [Acidimicrobiales bacterium]